MILVVREEKSLFRKKMFAKNKDHEVSTKVEHVLLGA